MKPRTLPTPPLQLVGRRADLVPFATSQWMGNGRQAAHVAHVDRAAYDHHQHATIERLWNDPGVTWLFAAHAPDPNYVFGFLVGEATNQGAILHWLLVRRSMRGCGIARALLRAFLDGQVDGYGYYTSSTPHFRRVLNEAGKDSPFGNRAWLYDPWLLWEPTFRGNR